MTLYMIAIAFSAGIISAMVGAFQECMLAGLVMVAMTAFPQYSFLGDTVSYGLFPYIAFTGGVVATAYASKIRKHNLGGAAILTSLTKFQDISVLLVAAAVSILSMITAWLINKTGWVIDAGSVSVIFYSCLTRKFLGDGKFLNDSYDHATGDVIYYAHCSFQDSLKNGKPFETPLSDGISALIYSLAAKQSSEEQITVKVPDWGEV